MEFLEHKIAAAGGVDEFLATQAVIGGDVEQRDDGTKWHEQLDNNEKIDPFEGMDPAEIAVLQGLSRGEIQPSVGHDLEEFSDDYRSPK